MVAHCFLGFETFFSFSVLGINASDLLLLAGMLLPRHIVVASYQVCLHEEIETT